MMKKLILIALLAAATMSAQRGAIGSRTVVIPAAQAISAAVDLAGQSVVQIIMPAAWDAADLTVQASYNCSTFADLYDAYGAEYVIRAAAGRAILVPPSDLTGIRCIKLRSGTSGGPVAQAAARSIVLVLRGL